MAGNFALFASPRPQVVAFHNLYHFGALARRSRRQCGRRLALRLAVESLAARLSVRRATMPVALSWSMRRAIEEDLGPVDRLRVIYPGAAPPFSVAPASGTKPNNRMPSMSDATTEARKSYVLAVANDYPHKDWEGIISAFEQRPDLPPLIIVGRSRTAKRHAELQRRISQKGLEDRVQLFGAVEDAAEIGMLYANAACFVAHSYLETFPQTPYEAMFYGSPVVASDIPSHRELCGDFAIFYPPDRPDLLAAAVGRALTEHDPARSRSRPQLATRTWVDHAEEFASVLACAALASKQRRLLQ
jgi:glycosyltransferase involved in cell wall biosynthesis